jgi:GNAT superfamily N-acetyltransferase
MITIKPAKHNDKPYLIKAMACLLEHVQDSSQDEYLVRLTDDYIKDSEQWLEKILISDESHIYVAKDDDVPVAYIIGTITQPFIKQSTIEKIGLIEHCWVEKKYRMNGLALKLVKIIEDWFKANSIQYIDVQYLLGNVEAELTWEKLGYKPYRVISRKVF